MQPSFQPTPTTNNQAPTDTPYHPERVLDQVSEELGVSDDIALAKALKIAAPLLDRIRHGQTPLRASILLRINEVSGMSMGELRSLMGDRRSKFRMV
jgi:plasmid maintenance system antidote protein VapI